MEKQYEAMRDEMSQREIDVNPTRRAVEPDMHTDMFPDADWVPEEPGLLI